MKWTYMAVAGLVLALAACGPEEEPETSPDWAVFDAQQDAATAAASVTATPDDIGALLNARRSENGLAPLSPSAQLAAAAQVHARDMARNGFFSHTGSDKSSPGDRVRGQGYGYCFVAENIAQGQTSAEQAMQSWMNSPGHRRNNLSTRSTQYGAARSGGDYWVLVFARPGC